MHCPVVTLPEDCIEKVAPATTIKRMKVREHQAAELWDDATASGEVAVVVGGRFVAMVEATKAENLEAVWTLLRAIGLKAVEALK